MNRSTAFLLPLATMLCLSSAAFAKSDSIVAQTTFDADLDGWTSNTPPDVSWKSNGGNPGGEAFFTDVTSGVGTYLIAPDKFLTKGGINFTKLEGKAYISFQHLMVKETGVEATGNYTMTLSGPNGTAIFAGGLSIVLAKKNKWMTVAVPLIEADWTMQSGTWAGLLANVTSIQIPMEMVSNDGGATDQEALDNIMIVSHPAGFTPK